MKDVHSKGFSVVEILAAVGIFVTAIVAFTASFTAFTTLIRHTAERTQAALLLEEGAEAVQLLRDTGWDTAIAPLADDTPYSFYWNGSTYVATTTETVIADRYVRTITFAPAYRNGADQIADSGSEDEDTRRVMIAVYRLGEAEAIAEGETLVHNIYDIE